MRGLLLGIIDARSRDVRPTVVTTNLSFGELSAVIDDRLASRLAEGQVIRMEGSDRRLGEKEKP